MASSLDSVKRAQLYLLHKGDNLASYTVDSISHETHNPNNLNWYTSRVEAYLMPPAVAYAIIQEGIGIGCELIRRCTYKKGSINLEESFVTLCKLSVAFFTTLLADITFISLYSPEIYQREKVLPPPPDKTPIEILKATPRIEKFCIGESQKALAGSMVEVSISDVDQKAFHPERGAEEIDSYIWTPSTIEIERNEKHIDETGEDIPEFNCNFKSLSDYLKPQIGVNIEGLLYPKGTFKVQVNGASLRETLPGLFSKSKFIDALIINNCTDLEYLKELDPRANPTLFSIRTLSIRGIDQIAISDVQEIAGKFLNLKGLDLRDVEVTGGALPSDFTDKHVVVTKSQNNAQHHLDLANEAFATGISEFHKRLPAYLEYEKKGGEKPDDPWEPILNIFGTYHPNSRDFKAHKNNNPIYAYISNLSAFRGIQMGGLHINILLGRIRDLFPSLTHFDLSMNDRADIENLGKIVQFPNLKTLKLRGCKSIFKRDDESSEYVFVSLLSGLYDKGLNELDIQCIKEHKVSGQFSRLIPDMERIAYKRGEALTLHFSNYRQSEYEPPERKKKVKQGYWNIGSVRMDPLHF